MSLAHVTPIRANVTDAIGELLTILPGSGSRTFRSLTRGIEERVEIVVRFLAVLELFKQGYVELEQVQCFGDLTIEWIGTDTDREMAISGIDAYEG